MMRDKVASGMMRPPTRWAFDRLASTTHMTESGTTTVSANRKGDRRERELVNALDGAGFAVMRAPASGAATERELPDVLAGDGETFYAIEAKSSAGDPIYLTGEEVEALLFFARNFGGAKARIAVRFDREDCTSSTRATCTPPTRGRTGSKRRKRWATVPTSPSSLAIPRR